jgi:hypothetical protein
MKTPFDSVIDEIRERGYHNHRLETHSDIVSDGVFGDLLKTCEPFGGDYQAGAVGRWSNVPAPGARQRKIDLLIARHAADQTSPDLSETRICLENKSVVTAHRNRDARFDDLNEVLQVLYRVKPEAILVATVLIGLSQRVLNVPDRIGPLYKGRAAAFKKLTHRFSTGDQRLWTQFPSAVSTNRSNDPQKTVEKCRGLPRRPPGQTHVTGYDYILLVPVLIDNVNPPSLARDNPLGIDIDRDYAEMLEAICKAYRVRWNL